MNNTKSSSNGKLQERENDNINSWKNMTSKELLKYVDLIFIYINIALSFYRYLNDL